MTCRLALQTDSTRVITLFLGSVRTPGVTFDDGRTLGGYHNLSHHGKDEVKLSRLEEIENAQMELFGEFLRDLKSVNEVDGNLLDNTMVLYGCHMGDANIHNNSTSSHSCRWWVSAQAAPRIQLTEQHPAVQCLCHAPEHGSRD